VVCLIAETFDGEYTKPVVKTPIPGPRSKVSGCGTGLFSALELVYLRCTLHPQPTGIVGRSQQDSGIIICNENMFLGDPSWKLVAVGVVINVLPCSILN